VYIYAEGLPQLAYLHAQPRVEWDVAVALYTVLDFYPVRLLPWPLDEILLAGTLVELVLSHVITIAVGLGVATVKSWARV